MIRTALTELIGIRYPVVQAAMGTCPGRGWPRRSLTPGVSG